MTATTTVPTSPPQANAVLTRIRDRARAHPRRIALPECDDARVKEAARILAGEGLAEPVDFVNELSGHSDLEIRQIMRDNNAALLALR